MRASSAVPLALTAALLGFAVGRLVSPTGVAPAEVARVEAERDDAVARAERAEAALADVRRNARAAVPAPADGLPPRAVDPPPGVPAAPGTAGPTSAETGPDGAPPATAAERAQRVRELAAAVDPAFEHADGDKALELLRKLSAIVPEGRSAAMDLAVRLNEDLNGDGRLHLDVQTFYLSLGDTPIRDLMVWSMENPSPPEFRVLSAWSLPWVLESDRKVEVLVRALGKEKDTSVQQALVLNLTTMNDSRARAALVQMLGDPTRDAAIRAQIATSLATSESPELAQALDRAANADPDDRVRSAARAALIARKPPVDGYLVTFVYAGGNAANAGLLAGDILVSYDTKPTRTARELKASIDAGGAGETASVVVLRQGVETTLQVRRGRMGVTGRSVTRDQ